MTPLLTDRYRDRLAGVLSCYDRIVITGTLPGACFAEGMTKLLRSRGIRIFDYPVFAAELRDRVRAAAATIEHIAKSHVRKEAVVARPWRRVVIIPVWCTSSRQWRRVMPTSPGTTSRRTEPSGAPTAASVCCIS